MKIGMYISPAHMVPPNEANILAPWILMAGLVNALVAKGHEVHVFAARGTKTNGILHHYDIEPTVHIKEALTVEDYRVKLVVDEHFLFTKMMETALQEKIPLIHIHHPIESLYPLFGKYPGTQFVFTFHDPISPDRMEVLTKINSLTNCQFVAISDAQRVGVALKFVGMVYNGVSLSSFRPIADRQTYAPYIAVGRIIPNKGFEDAILAIQKTGERLIIAGQVYTKKQEMLSYFKEKIEPHIDGAHVFLEPLLKRDHLVGHYQTAKALLFPIKWDEPFGLVMVEAMACGTPVIAYNRGSVSEIVRDGVTGFIVDPDNEERPGKGTWVIKKQGLEGLKEAIGRIGEINRKACRRHVEGNFTLDKMVEGYEKVYQTIIDKNFHSGSGTPLSRPGL